MADTETGTYHVDIWNAPVGGDAPPSFVCQLCLPAEAERLTREAVEAHIRAVHGETPVASGSTAPLLALAGLTPPAAGEESRHAPSQ